jgi:hypothetical protein
VAGALCVYGGLSWLRAGEGAAPCLPALLSRACPPRRWTGSAAWNCCATSISEDADVADIPVIVVSAEATPGQTEKALTLGALHCATQPLAVVSFLALVENALEGIDTRRRV